MSDSWHGAIAHTEMGSTDTQASMEFLTKVFGLKFEAAPPEAGMEYNMAYKPGEPSCAVRPVMPQEPGPSTTPYFLTGDIDKTIADATAGGATIVLPKTAIPGGMGYMSWMQIPGGPMIALMENGQ